MNHRIRHYGKGEYGIEGPYNRVLIQACKEIPGMHWEPSAKAWIGYADAVDVAARRSIASKIPISGMDLLPHPGEHLDCTLPIKFAGLWPFQKTGAEFIVTHADEGCLLADDMGLGKSAQFLRAARAIGSPTLVVCPGYLKGSWLTEAKLWWPEAGDPLVLYGTKHWDLPPKMPLLTICNYDILAAWEPYLQYIKIIGFDEAQYLQSPRSKRSKAARSVARRCQQRVALSGTPMLNRPSDLWNVVDTVSEGRFGELPDTAKTPAAWKYLMRYCDAHQEQVTREKLVWNYKGASNLKELQYRLQFFMLRRTEEDVNLQLPEMQRQILPVEVARGQRVPFGAALKSEAALRRALDYAADGKLDDVVDLVAGHATNKHSVVVFTHRRAMAEAICSELQKKEIDAGYVHGGVSDKKFEDTIARKHAVLCATMDSVGLGLNTLVYADVGVFAELHWIPSVLAQCEKRLHRPGQLRRVLIQFVIAEGTADELIRDGAIAKLKVIKSALGKLSGKMLEELDGEMRKNGVEALKKLALSLVA